MAEPAGGCVVAASRLLRRDRRIIAVCVLVAGACAGSLGWRVAVADPAPVDVVVREVDAGADGVLRTTFAGDTMLGDGAQGLLDRAGHDAVLAGVEGMLDGDVVILNAEGPITTATTPARPGAAYSYRSDPEVAAALARGGVDVLALGNNHAMDYALPGLRDTRAHAAAAGLTTFGAGVDREEALRPLLLRTSTQRLAVVSFGEDFGPTTRSGSDRPGMVSFSARNVARGLDLARRAGADQVVAMVHWGDNYADVDDSQRVWARTLVDAGYDLVIGSGSHTTQPIDVIDGVPVAYGLGNFVFGAPGRFATFGRDGIGLVADVEWSRGAGSTSRLSVRCIQTDNAVVHYVPRPCDAAHVARARTLVGPEVTWTGPVGTLTF